MITLHYQYYWISRQKMAAWPLGIFIMKIIRLAPLIWTFCLLNHIHINFHINYSGFHVIIQKSTYHIQSQFLINTWNQISQGRMQDGREIAVKKLATNSMQGKEEFENEVRVLLKMQHRNLVQLFGCCVQERERILVYEYLPNNSLDKFLFGIIYFTR